MKQRVTPKKLNKPWTGGAMTNKLKFGLTIFFGALLTLLTVFFLITIWNGQTYLIGEDTQIQSGQMPSGSDSVDNPDADSESPGFSKPIDQTFSMAHPLTVLILLGTQLVFLATIVWGLVELNRQE